MSLGNNGVQVIDLRHPDMKFDMALRSENLGLREVFRGNGVEVLIGAPIFDPPGTKRGSQRAEARRLGVEYSYVHVQINTSRRRCPPMCCWNVF